MAPTLPPFVPFPEALWRDHIVPVEWEACLSTWVALAEAYATLSDSELLHHESIAVFQLSFMKEVASSGVNILGSSPSASQLLRSCFLLTSRHLRMSSLTSVLLSSDFLSDFSRVYGKKRTSPLIKGVFHTSEVETSLNVLKKSLILSLDSGIKGDLRILEARLKRLNHLIHSSSDTAAFFLAGSDFLDGLIACYQVMNPPLRKTIITTAYLCLVGLTEGESPKLSILSDQLYSLKAAADDHKAGPLNANDSMVAELVTATPILRHVQHRLEESASTTTRTKAVITALEAYRKAGANVRPKRLVKRKIEKGKGILKEEVDDTATQMRMHQMSQISQIQDLFPDLGTGFITRLLDEYQDDTERVVAALLEDSLPSHLASVDRSKELSVHCNSSPSSDSNLCSSPERGRRKSHDIAPRSTLPQISTRRNVFDDDEFDNLAVDMGSLHFGKRNPEKTTEDILKDRSSAPSKAAILSALSAFDADDDERDDTYDAVDAGFVVNEGDVEDVEDQKRKEANEEALYRAYQSGPASFARDAVTRRSQARTTLKQATGMTDEAIEGWATMLPRTPNRMRQLEAKYSQFSGNQPVLQSTAWRASPAASGAEDSEADGRNGGRRGGPRGGRPGGRGRGRGGNVSGPVGDQGTESARRHKEANKSSRANHNRRDQREKKMNRGGAFPG